VLVLMSVTAVCLETRGGIAHEGQRTGGTDCQSGGQYFAGKRRTVKPANSTYPWDQRKRSAISRALLKKKKKGT
jgi:hypothetical protein